MAIHRCEDPGCSLNGKELDTQDSRDTRTLEELIQDQEADARAKGDEWLISEYMIYPAPWRDRLANNTLGPWYGPTTEGSLETARAGYYETREHGLHRDSGRGFGHDPLWDSEKANRQPTSVTRYTNPGRKDRAEVISYVEWINHDLPPLQLAVYYAYFIDCLSQNATAKKLNRSPNTIKECLRRIRSRVHRKKLATM